MHLSSCAALAIGLGTVLAAQTFSAKVQQVAVAVTVQSQSGETAANLTADDFRVFDNGRPRPIVTFGTFPQPLHILLLLDTSRSVRNSVVDITSAARAVIAQLAPDDSIRVGTFSDALRLSPPLSATDSDLAGRLSVVSGGNATLLFDALVEGCTVFNTELARRVIVVISDGVDTGSSVSASAVMHRAAETNVTIYAVGVSSRYTSRGKSIVRGPDSTLRNIAEDTGGRYVSAGARTELDRIFAAIIQELHEQYILGFTPLEADGGIHSLVVTTRQPNMRVRARQHYFAPSGLQR